MKPCLFRLGLQAILFFSLQLSAQVPQLINYQARLTDPVTGLPVADGAYSIIFSIYEVPEGGTPLWTETQSVQTNNGIYSVLLGSQNPIDAALFSGAYRYLGITVGTDPEMTPRKQMVSVPFAFQAQTAETLSGTVSGNFWFGDRDRDGYGDFLKALWTPINVLAPQGYVANATDCDDNDQKVNPGMPDKCDNIDNDCDSIIDEDCINRSCMEPVVSFLNCLDENNCEMNNPLCLSGYCSDELDQLNTCIESDCLYQLLLNPEDLPFDDTWIVYEKAGYIVEHCGSPDADGDGYSVLEGDCDDSDAGIHPGAAEICDDGIDQDCNGRDAVCGDNDGDGYTAETGDCNDNDPSVHPGANDGCDGIDNNCNDIIDEDGFWITFYQDADGDGYGNSDVSQLFCEEAEPGFVEDSSDCDDGDPEIHPYAAEICDDGIDQDCNGTDLPCSALTDDDGDGYSEVEGDCDDAIPSIHPGATEICDDGIDQDCNGEDLACSDLSDDDGDGYNEIQGDCDDANASIHPGATDICGDGIDQDCDGNPDDGCCHPMVVEMFECIDANGCSLADAVCIFSHCNDEFYGAMECLDMECTQNLLADPELPFDESWTNEAKAEYVVNHCGTRDGDGDGYIPVASDCDDFDPAIHPGATDICGDGVDQNCSGSDAGCDDADEDGYTAAEGDCDDNDPHSYPGAEEQCDNKDNNCDDIIDDGLPTETWYRDADSDGYGTTQETVEACMAPEGFAGPGDDCDDSNPAIHPNAPELCDGIDNDCNDLVDDGAGSLLYRDYDEDGYGSETDFLSSCVPVAGYIETSGDCDDTSADIHPGAPDVCDEQDNDCDGEVDEDYNLVIWYEDWDGDGFGDPNVWQEEYCAPEGFVDNSNDCDDNDETIHPGAPELCGDGIDQDCDGSDLACPDLDEDGYTSDVDCDDADPSVHPGATEICEDAIDQDCDGLDLLCDDVDNDGDGYTENQGDCDDTDGTIHPGATEICDDAIDQNCDGLDLSCDDVDNDGDGYTENQGDCDDMDGTIHPGAIDICEDAIDQDCDGLDLSCNDVDNDGDGYTENQGDCDDTDLTIHPGADDLCGDAIDQDCDGIDPVCLPAFMQEVLDQHNDYRQLVGVDPLTWSADLATLAQGWADYLAANNVFLHNPDRGYTGENICLYSSGAYTGNQAVDLWVVEEKQLFEESNGECDYTECGHYTQVVWSTTSDVGCGKAQNPFTNMWIVVCNYAPPGNIIGQTPY